MNTVSGKFNLELSPLDAYTHGVDGMHVKRMSIDKAFDGPLFAHSKGELISAITTSLGDFSYVAIEQVKGELEGRKGSFILAHYGVMEEGQDRLLLEVVPNSGTGELSGLRGSMSIQSFDVNGEENHSYTFDYSL